MRGADEFCRYCGGRVIIQGEEYPMRCTQLIGLSDTAADFINKNVAWSPKETCSKCGVTSGGEIVRRVYDTTTGRQAGMFDDGPDLYEYTLKDGSVVQEVVQVVPWSSGPCIHLCLRNHCGKWIYKWADKDIEDC